MNHPRSGSLGLTDLSPAGGCGCKMSASFLNTILDGLEPARSAGAQAWVDFSSRDDAAVFPSPNGEKLTIFTTDFFTPIVDEPADFGKIAAANALSDVFSMGGKPYCALSILGWPDEMLPAETARDVLQGAQAKCREVETAIVGGHSIYNDAPFFGLAVIGTVSPTNLKRNSTAAAGDLIYLSKKIGTGILCTAIKKKVLQPGHRRPLLAQMESINRAGAQLGELGHVHAMTDITGFGLLGHLVQMCRASRVAATIELERIPQFPFLSEYVNDSISTTSQGGKRNWNSFGSNATPIAGFQRDLVCDPQTNGGLLVAVAPSHRHDFERSFQATGSLDEFTCIGQFTPSHGDEILVRWT